MGAWRYEIYLLVFNLDISRVGAYRVEHSKINFISPCTHVLFSIYAMQWIAFYPVDSVIQPLNKYWGLKNHQ